MYDKDEHGVAETLCENGNEGDEKKVCEFILQNLLKIKGVRGKECNIENIEEELKEYVHCTTLNLWSALYIFNHCDKQDVVHRAYNVMESLKELGRGTQCKECTYRELKPMVVVKGMDMLKYMYLTMNGDAKIMNLIKKDPKPTENCEEQRKNLTKLGLQINSMRTSGGQQHQAAAAQPEMTKEQFNFISQLITKWVMTKGIWGGMKTVFTNLMSTLKGEQPIIATTCETGLDSNFQEITPWDKEEKELCKAMMKVMSYTNGLTQNFGVRDGIKGEDTVTTYLRCLIGTVVLAELYGSNCRFDKVLPHVSGMVHAYVESNLMEMTDKKCSEFSLESAQIGGKLISKTVVDWINSEKWKQDGRVEKYAMEYMGISDQRSKTNISDICGIITDKPGGRHGRQPKEICKRIIRIIYWMERWDKERNKWKGKSEKKEEQWEQYLKCILGHTIILEILKNKCNADQVMNIISETMRGRGNNFPSGKDGIECDWVKMEDIKSVKELFGTHIQNWINDARKRSGGVRDFEQVMQWMECKPNEKQKEEQEQKEKPCHSERIIDLLGAGRSSQLRDLVNTDPSASAPSSYPGKEQASEDKKEEEKPDKGRIDPDEPDLQDINAGYYFFLGKRRKRYGRAHQVSDPTVQEQFPDHVDNQDGPYEYTLVRERRQPRSVPKKAKRPKKQGVGRRRPDRPVGRRMIIDIHLEVLDECQKGNTKLVQEDFFEILVQDFMGSHILNEEDVPREDFPRSVFKFWEEDFVPPENFPKERVRREGVPSSDSWFREEDFVLKEGVAREDIPKEDVSKEQVPSSDCGLKVDVPKEQVRGSGLGFREEDFVPKEDVPREEVSKEQVPS
ncbi:SICA-like antigen [Plasmodium coatneyi]|uniref:SICA-like antigen n=1 Tax=Plasmodium coatneyi TaxID=208452 RepID=A0A1B1E736_9APIC|nr:SICA-like antigen [Plasmodium coatneyi]ANQ10811.1 SICA-like antigen [Plasmodium coatneyi]